MIQRWPVVPHTYEDWAIMKNATQRWMLRHDAPAKLAQIYVPADRIDAMFMLYCQDYAARCGVYNNGQWVDFRGARR